MKCVPLPGPKQLQLNARNDTAVAIAAGVGITAKVGMPIVAAGWDKLGSAVGAAPGARLGLAGGNCAHKRIRSDGKARAKSISTGRNRTAINLRIRMRSISFTSHCHRSA